MLTKAELREQLKKPLLDPESQHDSIAALLDTTDPTQLSHAPISLVAAPVIEKTPEEIHEAISQELNTPYWLSIRVSLGVLTFAFGPTVESLQFYLGLSDLSGKLLWFIPITQASSIALLSSYFVQASTLNLKFTDHAIDNIVRIYKGEKSPEWKALSPENERKANVTSIVVNSFALVLDAMAWAYYLHQENFSNNHVINFALGLMTSFTTIPTECFETHQFIRSCFAEKEEKEVIPEPEHPDHFLITIFKWFLKICGAVEDMTEIYTTVAAMSMLLLNTESAGLRYPILLLSLANGLNDLMFNGKNSSEAIDKLKAALYGGDISVKDVVLFAISLFAASMIGHAQFGLILAMLRDPEAALPYPLPKQLPQIIALMQASGAALREWTNYTYYIKSMLDGLDNAIMSLAKRRQLSHQHEVAFNEEIDEPQDDDVVIVTVTEKPDDGDVISAEETQEAQQTVPALNVENEDDGELLDDEEVNSARKAASEGYRRANMFSPKNQAAQSSTSTHTHSVPSPR